MKSRVSGVGPSSHGKTVCNGTKVQSKEEEVNTVELVVVRKYCGVGSGKKVLWSW